MHIDLALAERQAQELVARIVAGEPRALETVRWNHPRFRSLSGEALRREPFALADAERVVARLHHFDSWGGLAEFSRAVASGDEDVVRFERAADALIAGDEETLRDLLTAHPALITQRSTRAHRSTLLHYVSANGVEDDRQITPPNIVAIAQRLLRAGADVNAASDAYGGGSTTLGLVTTSAHPRAAGVQIALMDLLLAHGARIDGPDDLPNLVRSAIANGCPEAAVAVARRGVAVDTLYAAAATARMAKVAEHFLSAGATQREAALMVAAQQGHAEVVEWLLDHDVAVDANDGMTALHHAAGGGHLSLVNLLLTRGAPLEAVNEYGGTVLSSTLWFAHHVHPQEFTARKLPRVITRLVEAGARTDVYPDMQKEINDAVHRTGETSSG